MNLEGTEEYMGIYDAKIAQLNREVNNLYLEIDEYKKSICELEELVQKCSRELGRADEIIKSLLGNIDRKQGLIQGNFVNYYRGSIEKVIKNNGLQNVAGNIANDKERIIQKIEEYNNKINVLNNQIACKQKNINYLRTINIEKNEGDA